MYMPTTMIMTHTPKKKKQYNNRSMGGSGLLITYHSEGHTIKSYVMFDVCLSWTKL